MMADREGNPESAEHKQMEIDERLCGRSRALRERKMNNICTVSKVGKESTEHGRSKNTARIKSNVNLVRVTRAIGSINQVNGRSIIQNQWV